MPWRHTPLLESNLNKLYHAILCQQSKVNWCQFVKFHVVVEIDRVLSKCLTLGLYSLSTRSCKVSKAVRLDVIKIVLLWKLTGIFAAQLPRCLSNFRMISLIIQFKLESRSFWTSQYLAARLLIALWIETLLISWLDIQYHHISCVLQAPPEPIWTDHQIPLWDGAAAATHWSKGLLAMKSCHQPTDLYGSGSFWDIIAHTFPIEKWIGIGWSGTYYW